MYCVLVANENDLYHIRHRHDAGPLVARLDMGCSYLAVAQEIASAIVNDGNHGRPYADPLAVLGECK